MMAFSPRGWLAGLTVLSLSALPVVATAEEAKPQAGAPVFDQAVLDKAEALFFSGLAHYRGQQFEAAAVDFQKALVATGHRDLLFNIARSRELLGDTAAAVRWYRAYLATIPADETAVIHRIRLLGGDPSPKALVKAKPVAVPEGPLDVEVGAGPWPWVAAGVGLVAAGAGTYFGLAALDDASVARSAELRGEAVTARDDAESKAMLADVAFGVGAAAIGTAVYLWWRADADAEIERNGGLEFGATPGGMTFGLSGQF